MTEKSKEAVLPDDSKSPTHMEVIMPNGQKVQASTAWEPWMEVDGATGWVVPELLAPDPEQPRTEMNEADLAELTGSVGTVGVRQRIDVTPLPRVSWIEVKSEHRTLPLLIVAGHRRTLATVAAKVGALPITIHIYANADEHDDDRSISNKQREGLSELDEGREMVRKMKSRDLTVAELARRWGYSQPKAQSRVNLTQLDPAFWPLLGGAKGSRRPLAPIVGGHLGSVKPPTVDELYDLRKLFELDLAWSRAKESEKDIAPRKEIAESDELDEDQMRFEWQRVLLAAIRHRALDSTNAINLIYEHKAKLSAATHSSGRPSERHQPKRRLEILDNLLKAVTGSEVNGWTKAEFVRICANSSREDLDAFLKQLEAFSALAKMLATTLTGIRETKKATRPEVLQLMHKDKAG